MFTLFSTRRRAKAALAVVSAALIVLGQSASGSGPIPAVGPSADGFSCPGSQQMMSYYRIWRDVAVKPQINWTRMGDLPKAVDIAFVFDDGGPNSGFYRALRATYLPQLHARGTRVVKTIGIQRLLDRSYPNTDAGHQQLAAHLVKENVDAYGLDGLDVDVEAYLAGEDLQRAKGVFSALAQRLGHTSGTRRLLIYDTNQDGTSELFQFVAPKIDYLLVQEYGAGSSHFIGPVDVRAPLYWVQNRIWATYAPFIQACQFLIGFSFYEEHGPHWDDTTEPMTESRAWQYARWQPPGATKGGIFSYAVDRDGVAIGDDRIQPTTYSWTKALKAALR